VIRNLRNFYHVKKIFLFFIASLSGVTVDLCLFYYLSKFLEMDTYIVNSISSTLAIITTYFVTTSILFIKDKRTKKDFIVICIWYGFSISFFSFFIDLLHITFVLDLFISKIISLPLSFITNFTFNSFYLGRKKNA
jgi:putative flippase GtrA